jgi:hypothetical protein
MLRMENSNVNFNGSSSVEENVIASMSANYSGDGSNVYFSFGINNINDYLANAEVVDADFIAFKESVLETIGTML